MQNLIVQKSIKAKTQYKNVHAIFELGKIFLIFINFIIIILQKWWKVLCYTTCFYKYKNVHVINSLGRGLQWWQSAYFTELSDLNVYNFTELTNWVYA